MLLSSEPIVSARCTRRPASERRRLLAAGALAGAGRQHRGAAAPRRRGGPAGRSPGAGASGCTSAQQHQDEDRERLGDQPVGGLGEPGVPGRRRRPRSHQASLGGRRSVASSRRLMRREATRRDRRRPNRVRYPARVTNTPHTTRRTTGRRALLALAPALARDERSRARLRRGSRAVGGRPPVVPAARPPGPGGDPASACSC